MCEFQAHTKKNLRDPWKWQLMYWNLISLRNNERIKKCVKKYSQKDVDTNLIKLNLINLIKNLHPWNLNRLRTQRKKVIIYNMLLFGDFLLFWVFFLFLLLRIFTTLNPIIIKKKTDIYYLRKIFCSQKYILFCKNNKKKINYSKLKLTNKKNNKNNKFICFLFVKFNFSNIFLLLFSVLKLLFAPFFY